MEAAMLVTTDISGGTVSAKSKVFSHQIQLFSLSNLRTIIRVIITKWYVFQKNKLRFICIRWSVKNADNKSTISYKFCVSENLKKLQYCAQSYLLVIKRLLSNTALLSKVLMKQCWVEFLEIKNKGIEFEIFFNTIQPVKVFVEIGKSQGVYSWWCTKPIWNIIVMKICGKGFEAERK